jgi:SWI/SNF-related matrix-associated actin-dependent regulator 1 of chromatin subfamily A
MFSAVQTPSKFEITFDYSPSIKDQVKAIPGSRWNPVRKIWTAPLEHEVLVNNLVKRYGARGIEKLNEEYDVIPSLPELNMELSLKRKLFPFQENGVAAGLRFKRFINGDDPGLGKTTEAIATIIAANAFPCLVVCPSSLKINWQREWEMVAGIKSMILTNHVKNSWQQYYKVGLIKVFIVNYESLKKFFVEDIIRPIDPVTHKPQPLRLNHIRFKETIQIFKSVVGDELHRCKDGKTQQTKFMMGIARDKEYRIGLTGTPVVNKPKDLIPQLHIIGRLQDIGGFKYFMNRYCGGNGTGAYNLQELNYKISTTCFFRRQKKEVLHDLPEKVRQIMLCDITSRKEYNEALEDLGDYLTKWKNKTDAEVEKSLRGEIMVRIGICKNISARGKMNEVIDHIDDVIESGQKIVVFVHQKEIALRLKEHYPKAVTVRGDDSMDARQHSVDAFQHDDKTNIIICSIKAAGVGLTLTASSRVAFVELPWHPADADQCEDRCHRIGQKDSVQATYFLGKDTIDEKIYEIIESKRKVANTITGSVDNVQREIIDRLAESLFNTKTDKEKENEVAMNDMLKNY